MPGANVNLQDSFLNQVRKENTPVEVVLTEGTRLNGVVRGFDNFTLILHVDGMQHLIYKHAIAQMIASKATGGPKGERSGGRKSAHGKGGKKSAPPAEEPPKFNALDLSSVKIEEKAQDGNEEKTGSSPDTGGEAPSGN